jgi:DNA-binding NarL/FixJ family response regulator
MTLQKIILVNNSRFVGDILKNVIGKAAGFEIVAELKDITEFPETAECVDANLAIVVLPPDDQAPELVEQVIRQQSSMRFLLMGVDGSHARLKWNEPHEVPLDEKNLQELLALLNQGQPERINTSWKN